MAESDVPILVCTAWPYANGSLHVGHLAGVYVPADVFARYQRLRNRRVLMVSGTDAHGTPVAVRADNEGVEPHLIAERYHEEFVGYWRELGISFDLYTSTMTDTHRRIVQDEFRMLLEKGALFLAPSTGFYDPEAGRFLPDTYVAGECPHCHYRDARGNQCENCGQLLEPENLIDPRSRLNAAAVLERRERQHYYLDLPRFQEALTEWARTHTWWRTNVYSWTLRFLGSGLQPRAITRDLNWGVPVPLPGWDDKRIYVWFEAVTGYLSATIEWAERRASETDAWKQWWQNPAAHQYYFLGKDNIPFHTIIWPAILMGRGDMILPYNVVANEFMNFGSEKASKSAGVGMTVPQLLAAYEPDAIRYYMIANAPETGDTSFTNEHFIRVVNDQLVASWGNLVHRSLSLLHRGFNGEVPQHETDAEVIAAIAAAVERVESALDQAQFRRALNEAMALTHFGNEWFNRHNPWTQIREDRDGARHTLGSTADLLNALKVLFAPFLPHSSNALHRLLGFEGEVTRWKFEPVPAGRVLRRPTPLFRKIDETVMP